MPNRHTQRVLVIDARALHRSGIGRYVRELAKRLIRRNGFSHVNLVGDRTELGDWLSEIGSPPNVSVLPMRGGRYGLASQIEWPLAMRRIPACSVVWHPHWDVPLVPPACPMVVTIHDLIHLRVRGAAGPVKRSVVRAMIGVASRRARSVIVVSESTRSDLAAEVPDVAAKIRVVPNGVAGAFSAVPDTGALLPVAVRRPYILAVANRKEHKNLEAAVETLARLTPDRPNLTLVVMGERFPHWKNVLERATRLGVQSSIVDLPPVSDGALAELYRNAECLLFPSYYEGFGLPALEAMACGTPVVAARTSSIPEVVGDAAFLVDPDDYDGMAAAARALMADPIVRETAVRRGVARAATFTWDAAAEAIERILLEVAG